MRSIFAVCALIIVVGLGAVAVPALSGMKVEVTPLPAPPAHPDLWWVYPHTSDQFPRWLRPDGDWMPGETADERWERRMEYLVELRYCRSPYTAYWCFGPLKWASPIKAKVIYVPPPRRYGESFNRTSGTTGGGDAD